MGLPQPRLDDEFPSITAVLAENERLKRELAVARARVGELEARADIDPLLDILNRRGFERELKRALSHVKRYGTQAALMFVDLDGFKGINDRYGHAAGDVLLKAVARELIGHVRASDVVGRIGGDEFGVIVWRVEEPQAVAKARELEDGDCPRRHYPRPVADFGCCEHRDCAAGRGFKPGRPDRRGGPGHVCAQGRATGLAGRRELGRLSRR